MPSLVGVFDANTAPSPIEEQHMPSKTVTVGSSVGLHARPAAIISTAASKFDAGVTIAKGDGPGKDAGSALMLMTLGASLGSLRNQRATSIWWIPWLPMSPLP